jgi:small conductance mechanosensitive channel
MILEDQYGVGDVVDAGEATGSVEAVGLRTTRLRDVNGTVWYVRNGEILRVGNMSQGWARAVIDVPVAYSSDLGRARAVLKEVADEVWHDPRYEPVILEEPTVTGVETMNREGLMVRVLVKTEPMQQWPIARELRERIKARFDREGLALPLPTSAIMVRTEGPARPADEPKPAADGGTGA